MKTSEFPSVIAAKKAAEDQLGYYRSMKLPPLPVLDAFIAYPHGKDIVTGESMDTLYKKDVERLMREYAAAAVEAYRANLNPQLAAWIEGPHGAIRANPEFKVSGPQTIGWRLPLYLLDDHP